jgi:chromosome segregation ATPase
VSIVTPIFDLAHILFQGLKDAQSELKLRASQIADLEGRLQQLQSNTDNALENERQTIALLVSEKSSLTGELQRLEDVEASQLYSLQPISDAKRLYSELQPLEDALEKQRIASTSLEKRLQEVEMEKTKFEKLSQEEQTKAKGLSDLLRDRVSVTDGFLGSCRIVLTTSKQEHELHSTKSTLEHTKQEAEKYERRVRELEDRIQNDDRVERLESSLKNTQDHADELEFQLSKLNQVSDYLLYNEQLLIFFFLVSCCSEDGKR